MREIFLFMNVSLDGYFEGPGHDISWATQDFEAFSLGREREVDTLLFGHRTFDMMSSFWPTPQARAMLPDVAKFMNERRKIVASHHDFAPGWNNVTVISRDVAGEIRKLKQQPGNAIAMFGSNMLCVSLMEQGLVDEFQVMVNPVAIGAGTSLFAGLSQRVKLNLVGTHEFKSGTVLLTYKPA